MSGKKTAFSFSVMFLLLSGAVALMPTQGWSQLAAGKGTFLGNAITTGLFWPNYSAYWNQVTPGNAGKWGSVEGGQDSYNWVPLDDIYNFAINNRYPFRYHCLVWGQQQPRWIASLDSASQRAQVEEWIRLAGEKYGSTSFVDVVNEPFHAVPSYAIGLGGNGSTGWDWVVTAFRLARQYFFPGVKLTLNEYSILHDNNATSNLLRLVDTLRVRGLIDAIGIQGHSFEFKGDGYIHSPGAIKFNLQRLTATGVPVYITEFDINDPNDSLQLHYYQQYFPIFWEEPGVKGITFWGYMQGDMWQVNGYLIRSNGTERPALQWLRKYINSPLPPVLISPSGTAGEPRNPLLKWRSSATATSYHVQLTASALFGGTMPVDTIVADTVLRVDPLDANIRYYWRVSAVNDSGAGSYSTVAIFTTGDQVVAVEETEGRAMGFMLEQNYPNPFNPTTVVSSQLPVVSSVKLAIYDLLGREVAVLVDERRAAGNYQDTFDGSGLASGVYVCRMTAGSYVSSRQMILIK